MSMADRFTAIGSAMFAMAVGSDDFVLSPAIPDLTLALAAAGIGFTTVSVMNIWSGDDQQNILAGRPR